MTDDKMQPKETDGPEQAKPGKMDQETQQSAAAQPDQRPAPGRRPLFRS